MYRFTKDRVKNKIFHAQDLYLSILDTNLIYEI